MRTAVYPGSFDPITFGHLDIIQRAAKLFDKVIVLVSVNPTKSSDFTVEERVNFVKKCVAWEALSNVEVDNYTGLVVDYYKERGADVIVKGLRAVSDFEYEFQMALINKDLCHSAETVFLTANAANMFLSSSAIKQIATFGGDISAFIPEKILSDVIKKMKQKLEK